MKLSEGIPETTGNSGKVEEFSQGMPNPPALNVALEN